MTERLGEGSLRHVAVLAAAGAAVVHVAAVPVHLDEDTTHGVAFVVMAVALGLAAAWAWLGRGRGGLVAIALTNATVLGLWWWTRTIGLPGDGVEAVGVADAMAVALEAAALVAAVGALGATARDGSSWRRALVPMGALALVMAAVVPAVATAGDHAHDGSAAHDHGTTDVATAATAAAAPHDAAPHDAAPHDTASHDDTAPHDDTASHDDGEPLAAVGEAVPAVTADDLLLTTSISRVFAGIPGVHGHSGGTGNAHFEDQAAACVPTAQEVEAADHLITRTTFGLLRYADPATAVADGYRPLGFEPNGVNHYINSSYRGDGRTLDPEHPESILYGRTPDGGLFPVGVMFMMDEPGQWGPRVGGCLTPWHTHGPPFAPRGQESPEMMHVWTVPVPGGAFAEHVEGEYARLYLGVDPVNADQLLRARPTAAGTSGDVPTTTARRPTSIVEVLNALNVHRELLCSDTVRPRLEAALEPEVVDRICDPVMNGLLPGATAPPASELFQLFGGAR